MAPPGLPLLSLSLSLSLSRAGLLRQIPDILKLERRYRELSKRQKPVHKGAGQGMAAAGAEKRAWAAVSKGC